MQTVITIVKKEKALEVSSGRLGEGSSAGRKVIGKMVESCQAIKMTSGDLACG